MKQMKRIFMAVLISILFILPANTANALPITIDPNLIKLPDLPYISAHTAIKAVPVYRAYYGDIGVHRYTINATEYQDWLKSGKYAADGYAGYISPVPLPYTVPMWNMQKSYYEHYFVTSEASRDYVIGKYGYADKGIMGYVVPLNDKTHGDSELHQWYKGDVDEGEFETWNADHYYHNSVYYIGGAYAYEGPQFRVWSDAAVLQEITVLAPNGGETLTGDNTVNIRWSTLIPGGNVDLYYTLNPADGWSMIAEDLDNTGSYAWKVPNSVSSKAIVEARWTYEGIDANCYDQSDGFFAIKSGSSAPINWVITIKPIAIGALLAPLAPTNFSVDSGIIQKQPKLYWQDNADNETAYIVERKAQGGSFAKLTQLAANQTQYTDSEAQAGTVYYYRVKAINGLLSSAYSNEVAASVYDLPEITLPPVATGAVSMLFTLDQAIYTVNGEAKTMDVSPVSLNGRTMLPIRFVADPLGAITEWNGKDSKVTVTLGSIKLELWIGNNTALVNGKETLIDPENPDVKPILINSRTMLPMRFVAEKLGCDVQWLPKDRQVKVDYTGNYLDPQPEPPMSK